MPEFTASIYNSKMLKRRKRKAKSKVETERTYINPYEQKIFIAGIGSRPEKTY